MRFLLLMILFASCFHPPDQDHAKQAILIGYKLQGGYTDVYFLLRTKCMCETITIRYDWEHSRDDTRYVQNEKYTINFMNDKPISFKRNL